VLNSHIQTLLTKALQPAEKYSYGFADLRGLLAPKFDGFEYGISIARRLDDRIVDAVVNGPTEEYLEHYLAINCEMQAVCERIAGRLEQEPGIRAMAVVPTVSSSSTAAFDKSLPNLRYDISHKMVATRAGLGWIGKTDLFVSKQFGPRVRLASVLINREITAAKKPINRSLCGKCRICVDRCPAGAATGELWDIHTDRDVFFDAYKCREQCSLFGRTILRVDKRICGICVAVCPVGGITKDELRKTN
jgi:epoxyqueuosine reductase